jgi:hypothetical protein
MAQRTEPEEQLAKRVCRECGDFTDCFVRKYGYEAKEPWCVHCDELSNIARNYYGALSQLGNPKYPQAEATFLTIRRVIASLPQEDLIKILGYEHIGGMVEL